MKNDELLEIARAYGTPIYVFDQQEFRSRMAACARIVGERTGLCFAMKANPFLVSALDPAHKLEVCSPGELAICMAAGIDPSRIIYSGVNKEASDITTAIDYGAGTLTIESLLQAKRIDAVARKKGMTATVLARLTAGSQFGMSSEDVCQLIDHRTEFPGLKIAGLHYFAGTQRKKLKHQRREIEMLRTFMADLKNSHDFVVERLEYGPGLAVPYFADEDDSDDLAPLKELAPLLGELAYEVQLTVEMGRFFAASCGTYLTRVMDLKRNSDTNYAILDGGIHHIAYFGQMMGLHIPPIELVGGNGRRESPDSQESRESLKSHESAESQDEHGLKDWCLCGSLCTVNDVLTRSVELPNLELGDVLAFRRCGAYASTEGIVLLLSRALPRILLRGEDGTLQLARDLTDTYELNSAALTNRLQI